MSEEEKKKIEKAISILIRGNDIESASLILEKCVLENYIITGGRVNVLHMAVRQILNYIEETKNKGILDITKEKVDSNNKINEALDLIYRYGGIDGEHHKVWLIDQVVRSLTKEKYKKWVKNYKKGEDGANTYDWDTGIAP